MRQHTTDQQGRPSRVRSMGLGLRRKRHTDRGARGYARTPDGLLTHAGLAQAASAALEAVADGRRPALLVIGLDGVAGLQESGGLSAADELQQVIARRLRDAVGEQLHLARLSDHEFGVLFDDLAEVADALALATRLMSTVSKPVFLASQRRIQLGAACGLAPWGVTGETTTTTESLVRAADLAMREARRSGRNRTEVCTRELIATADERLAIGQDLRQALADRGLGVCYQPIVDIRTSELVGFEALVRWSHPVHGQVPPDRFVPLAEEFGLITELGRIVLSTATAQVHQWSTVSGLPLTVHVNVSGVDLAAEGFVDMVQEALHASGLEPQRLVLELTESAVVPDLSAAEEKCAALHALGVRIAMDDFGTGRGAVRYLQSLDVDILKVDRSYLEEGDTAKADALLAGMISLAHALDMQVYGEGIEDESQRHRLVEHGCTVGQGYYFSEPLTTGAAAAYLRTQILIPASGS